MIGEWSVEWRLNDLYVKHKHGDTEHETDLKTDAHGYRQAQCRDCEATLTDRPRHRGARQERSMTGTGSVLDRPAHLGVPRG